MGIFDNISKSGKPLTSNPEESATPSVKDKRVKGKIIWTNQSKGYGFINAKEEFPFMRIYFHWTGLLNDTLNFASLQKDMTVEFTPFWFDRNGEKKMKAIKIRVIV